MTSTANSSVTFRLEEKVSFLELDRITGQLWFKQNNWSRDEENSHNLVVTAKKSNGEAARMTLDMKIIKIDDINGFCGKFLCFYESITYHTVEDFNNSFKPHEIGSLAPKIYGRLCKFFDVRYELVNATDFITIKNNKLFTSAPLNHEMMSPGPELKIAVQCHLKSKATIKLQI
ncbi:CLUMA_CG014154, isoform A [Clunio marinus]|uniref:CLUMA_CG014154, isoform A n=1 Tax=Clunio marinus TaxID=568069 RepID=A0A1J1IL68_9DIPT|nr:CLUMA_CG014154, isoform A [Clunio marinus]